MSNRWRYGGRRRRWVGQNLLLGCLVLGAATALGVWLNGGHFAPRPWSHPPGSSLADHWEPVNSASIYVVDGDTFRIGGERARILNIDAPEMPDHAHCQREIELAYRARDFLRDRLASSQRVEVARQDLDRYGRTLATVRADGRDVGDQLIAAGLAQRWEGRHANWC